MTRLLSAARDGDEAARAALYEQVYAELKRLARRQLRAHGGVAGAMLETTALVNEAYLRLAGPVGVAVADRAHFFNLVARVMRHVIVDFARRRDAHRRGGGAVVVTLGTDAAHLADPAGGVDLEVLELDRALGELAAASPELARLVELRYFAGLELDELVPILERSERSLKRDWRRARAFLHAALAGRPLVVT